MYKMKKMLMSEYQTQNSEKYESHLVLQLNFLIL